MDCVLFYKVGKFYELYHMDADVGFQQCNLTYMRGKGSYVKLTVKKATLLILGFQRWLIQSSPVN